MRFILISSLLILFAFSARASIEQFENGTFQKTLNWGAYNVKFWHYDNENLADVVQIISSNGHVLKEIRGRGLLATSESFAPLEDLTGDGIPELRLMAWSGGAYCCYTDVVFDKSKSLKNILIYNGQEYHLTKNKSGINTPAQDLNHDKRPELILENDAISHINASTHGPTTVLVLRWNGKKYDNATRAFPKLARAKAFHYKQQIITQKCALTQSLYCEDSIAGFYANLIVANDERIGRTWLIQHGFQKYLLNNATAIKKSLKLSECRIGSNQKRLFYIKNNNPRAANSAC